MSDKITRSSLTTSGSENEKHPQIRGGLCPRSQEPQHRPIDPRRANSGQRIHKADQWEAPDVGLRGLDPGIQPEGRCGDWDIDAQVPRRSGGLEQSERGFPLSAGFKWSGLGFKKHDFKNSVRRRC